MDTKKDFWMYYKHGLWGSRGRKPECRQHIQRRMGVIFASCKYNSMGHNWKMQNLLHPEKEWLRNTESEDKIKQYVRTIYFDKMSTNSQHHHGLWGARGSTVGWGTVLLIRRSRVFHWHNPSGRTMALGLTQPLTEMSWCVGLTTLLPSCADCLEIWESQPPGTLRACTGL